MSSSQSARVNPIMAPRIYVRRHGTVFNKLWKMNFPVEVGTTTRRRSAMADLAPLLILSSRYCIPNAALTVVVRNTITSEEA